MEQPTTYRFRENMQVDNLLHAEAKRSLFELQARVRQRQRSLTATSTNFGIRHTWGRTLRCSPASVGPIKDRLGIKGLEPVPIQNSGAGL